MKYNLIVPHKNVPDKELLKDLKRVSRLLKKNSLSQTEYRSKGKYHPATIHRRFGGWNASLEKAGLDIKKHHSITEDELFNNLKHVWDSLGRQPRNEDMQKPLSRYSASVYTHRWGSWINALEIFVKQMNGKIKAGSAKRKMRAAVGLRRTQRHVPKALRFKVMQHDCYKCRLCGSSPAMDKNVKLHVDHIKPWSKGGETVYENLQTLCESCNLGKGISKMMPESRVKC